MQELNEAEMFRAVLNEMLDELKQLHVAVKGMNSGIVALTGKVDAFDKRLEDLQVVAPPPDLQPVQNELAAGVSGLQIQVKEGMSGIQSVFTQHMQKLTAALEAQPKPIVRRISFFSDNDYNGNYKYFIKACCLWTLGFLALVMIFKLVQPYFDRSTGYQSPSYRAAPYYPREDPPATTTVKPSRHSRKSSRKHRTVDSSSYFSDTQAAVSSVVMDTMP